MAIKQLGPAASGSTDAVTFGQAEIAANKNAASGYPGLDANLHISASRLPPGAQAESLFRRTGAISETFSRRSAALANQAAALTSGQMTLVAIPLVKGQVVSTITFMAGTSSAVTPTNQWFALWSLALAQLGITSDDTTTAWSGGAEKTLTLTSPYTVTTDALFYVSCMVAAATVPSMYCVSSQSSVTSLAPVIVGKDTTHTGLTNPASAPVTPTLANLANVPWAWVA